MYLHQSVKHFKAQIWKLRMSTKQNLKILTYNWHLSYHKTLKLSLTDEIIWFTIFMDLNFHFLCHNLHSDHPILSLSLCSHPVSCWSLIILYLKSQKTSINSCKAQFLTFNAHLFLHLEFCCFLSLCIWTWHQAALNCVVSSGTGVDLDLPLCSLRNINPPPQLLSHLTR